MVSVLVSVSDVVAACTMPAPDPPKMAAIAYDSFGLKFMLPSPFFANTPMKAPLTAGARRKLIRKLILPSLSPHAPHRSLGPELPHPSMAPELPHPSVGPELPTRSSADPTRARSNATGRDPL